MCCWTDNHKQYEIFAFKPATMIKRESWPSFQYPHNDIVYDRFPVRLGLYLIQQLIVSF